MTHVTEAQKAALDVEVAAKEQLREALDECRQQAKRDKMMQLSQVDATVVVADGLFPSSRHCMNCDDHDCLVIKRKNYQFIFRAALCSAFVHDLMAYTPSCYKIHFCHCNNVPGNVQRIDKGSGSVVPKNFQPCLPSVRAVQPVPHHIFDS